MKDRLLIVVSGLPGVGKSTVSKVAAAELEVVYLRADTIEQAMVEGGIPLAQVGGAGYQVAARVARENLLLGHAVLVDCVNPWPLTREMWRAAARDAEAPLLEVELFCSDAEEHRRRVENRATDVAGLRLPTWEDVITRDYRPWDGQPLRIDSSHADAKAAAKIVIDAARAEARRRETRQD